MENSTGQLKKNGRGNDKNGRQMHPQSLKNLEKRKSWKPGEQGRHKGMTITQRQQQMMTQVCTFDEEGRTWLEALAEGGLRLSLITPVALNNLLDRQEGKITQPIEGAFEITNAGELTDEQLAVIAATNILRNHASRGSRRATKEASSA